MFRIAICDDEKICRDQLCGFLRRFAERSGEAFELLVFESADRLLLNYPRDLDILFLDIAMSGIDGMSAARTIRKTDSFVCIIFYHHNAPVCHRWICCESIRLHPKTRQ